MTLHHVSMLCQNYVTHSHYDTSMEWKITKRKKANITIQPTIPWNLSETDYKVCSNKQMLT